MTSPWYAFHIVVMCMTFINFVAGIIVKDWGEAGAWFCVTWLMGYITAERWFVHDKKKGRK